MEEAKLGEEVGEEEVERAEAHDGHDVRGVGEEGVAGDGEDGGDGVEREDDVGEFDGDEGEEEDGDHAAAVFEDEELVLAKADGMEAGEPGDPARGVGFVFFLGGENEADGGDEQDGGEGVADPVEAGEETKAGGDEGSAHEDGSGDSPEEGLGLVAGLDFEDAEEEEEEEEVVDGERLFDGVAGEVLRCGLAAEGAKDEEGEGEGGGDPEDGGGDGGGVDLRRALIADVNELDREEGEDEEVKAYPVADRGFGEHLFWMLQREGRYARRVLLGCGGEGQDGSGCVFPGYRRDDRAA